MRHVQAAEAKGLPRIASIQNPYNLVNRWYEVGLAEMAHREDVGLLAYSPLAMGVLSGKYLGGARPERARLSLFTRFTRYSNPQTERATERYVALARQHGLDPAQMALAYVNSRPFVTANIIGATTMQQLKSDIDSIEVKLSQEVLDGIEAIHRDQPNPSA
jgi:aryl-alcohol dehydrogenase-like predicted oxidoreductase